MGYDMNLCNGLHMLSHEEGPDRTVFDGWSKCTRDRNHEGHHANDEFTWESTFHYDGDVCQICGNATAPASNPKLKVGKQWVHFDCDQDLRAEMAWDERNAEEAVR